jgi:ferric-dicitrate binding protein FerR (iron transport regulator)
VKVAKNPQQPFIASANGMEVLALGTEFNINSYGNEKNTNTTLIEGMVKVSKGNANTILKPGQQTELYSNGKLTAPKEVNTDEIVAWKDGLFHFESSDLQTILRQFARWYDVEVIYEGPVKSKHYFGIVKRSSTLKSVLELLQDNNILFRIEGKKLIVKSA